MSGLCKLFGPSYAGSHPAFAAIMIHVKYKLDKSPIDGIGIFADQNVQKGNLVYTVSPLLDVNITQLQFDSLEEVQKQEIEYWGYWFEPGKVWHVDFDDIHFINHSFTANTAQDFSRPEAPLVATRDIRAGEELTQNYLEFKSKEDLKRMGIET